MGNDFNGFSTEKYHEYGMRTSWKKHENLLNIQRFMAHEKTHQTKNPWKCHEIKWSRPCFFSWLFNDNEKAVNLKAIFQGVRIYGVFWGFLNSCPITKPWVFRERLNINGSWKMKWLLMTFSLPMNYTAGVLFMGKTETWLPWKFCLKLFSTVKSNTCTSLRICWLVNLKLYTCCNNPNPK